jgi:hypothetical protein
MPEYTGTRPFRKEWKMNKRYQLFTAQMVGGPMRPHTNEDTGGLVFWIEANTPEWVGRNLYGQGKCYQWRVFDLETGEVVAEYPTKERGGVGINILAVFRASLNTAGHDWEECVRIVDAIAPLLEEASWVETDTGRTFDLSFVPKEN